MHRYYNTEDCGAPIDGVFEANAHSSRAQEAVEGGADNHNRTQPAVEVTNYIELDHDLTKVRRATMLHD